MVHRPQDVVVGTWTYNSSMEGASSAPTIQGPAMRGRSLRATTFLCSYILGVTSCTLIFYFFACDSCLRLGKPRRPNNRIYVHNQFYNSKGLLNEGPGDNTDVSDDFDDMDRCIDLWHKYHTEPSETRPTEQSDGRTGKVFINCGGTFPWSVKLFIDTYPDAEEFYMHSFIKDTSYGVMYKQFANHSLYIMEASSTNDTVNQDLTLFGGGYPATEKVEKVDIAEWIIRNTKTSDFVVVRMESEEEREIVARIVELSAYDRIDKYYTTSQDASFKAHVEKELSSRSRYTVVQQWDTSNQTYSDFLFINPKSIPIKGKFIDKCKETGDKEKFALFLYSSEASSNVFRVINMLHHFSPNNTVPATMFLPFHFFNTDWGKSTFDKLFKTFPVGLYFTTKSQLQNNSTFPHRNTEHLLRNSAIAVQKIFQTRDSFLQNILYSKEVKNETLKKVIDDYNYMFFSQGRDITHLIGHVLNDGTVTMDMTGWTEGQYLMIDVDVENSEYLVLYMLRRFAPWLLDINKCSKP